MFSRGSVGTLIGIIDSFFVLWRDWAEPCSVLFGRCWKHRMFGQKCPLKNPKSRSSDTNLFYCVQQTKQRISYLKWYIIQLHQCINSSFHKQTTPESKCLFLSVWPALFTLHIVYLISVFVYLTVIQSGYKLIRSQGQFGPLIEVHPSAHVVQMLEVEDWH